MKNRFYVGLLFNGKRELFQSRTIPTTESHGETYLGATGPFECKADAEIMVKNPGIYSVKDAKKSRIKNMEPT